MNPFVNPNERGVALPSGCRDLIDVLKRPEAKEAVPQLANTIKSRNGRFLGEESGPDYDQFKATMGQLLGEMRNIVKRAYLARLTYDGSPAVSVVVCWRQVEKIEDAMRSRYPHMFGAILRRGDFYDFMIIDEELEQQLSKVCKPFYELA
jgi:hypothetical protein